MGTEIPDSGSNRQVVVCPLAGQKLPFQGPFGDFSSGEEEIDFFALPRKVLKHKWVIIISIVVFTALGFAYSSTRPKMFKAVAMLQATRHLSSEGALDNVGARMGGLMSLVAGGKIGGSDEGGPVQYHKALLKTHRFHLWAVKKYGLRAYVKELQPKINVENLSDERVAGIFGGSFGLESGKGDFTTLWVKTYSPEYSQKLAITIIDAINAYTAQLVIDQANNDISIFNRELENTTYHETKQTLFSLVAERTKTIMLAKAQPEYAFQLMDTVMVPSTPESKKTLIVVASFLIGCIVGGLIALGREIGEVWRNTRPL